MKKKPEILKINYEKLEQLLQRVKNALSEEDAKIIEGMVDTLTYIYKLLETKNIQLKRLLKQLLGIKSEKSKKVIKNDNKDERDNSSEINDSNETTKESDKNPYINTNNQNNEMNSSNKQEDEQKECDSKKGHGRNGANAYTGADIITVPHQNIKNGDNCPQCLKGKLYKQKDPGLVVYIEGNPPIKGTIYELEKFRCNLCGIIFQADLPNNLPSETNVRKYYDETAKTIIIMLKYSCGFPLNRLENLQRNLGIPLPASTQWDKIEEVADEIYPVYNKVKQIAAQGNIIYNDDTTGKILDLMKEIEEEKETGKKGRTGIFTTSIIVEIDDHKIALFFTGRQHAGENANDLLESRSKDQEPPIYMTDAKSVNKPKDIEVIECNCNAHARRYFVDLVDDFPQECQYVIVEVFGEIYKNERITKDNEMSSDERLKYHQKTSGPIMKKFYTWLNDQKNKNLIEPNSNMGKAISYVLNHWDKLTRFLHVAGAPLDNNICERAIKIAIYHRKNSLFYKNEHGAYIGDMFMSLIYTCILNGINAFDYLTELQRHRTELFKRPEQFLPWNYKASDERPN